MSYEKQTWQTGDVVTSAKLNHMEDGIAAGGSGGGVMVVNLTWGDDYCEADKTNAEIEAALAAGTPVFALVDGEEWFQVALIGGLFQGISWLKSGNNISVGFWTVNALGQWSETLRTITTS